SVIQAVCRRYVDHLRTELEQPTRTTRLMVGIAELLAALEPHEAGRRALVGLLTGNVAPGAALKLRSAGLDAARFRVGAYGSDSARRADPPAAAAARATALPGSGFAGSDAIIVCDSPDYVAGGAAAYGVLGWKGPASQRGMYRHRAEAEARVAAPDSVVTILEQLGFAVSLRIDRHVEVYRLGRAVLRLEWYPAMDVLLEVEGEPPDIELAITATGLARERFLPESLPYFVAQYEARTGRAAT